ncbi:MAG TPA: carboxypeptidase regulatory-like domain-containing protein [Candidatus Paceibacterota bacterium]|nr:carboxypeptidase regulatory-like domain-containing protein [Candidatus Paceibacterota bacterium]
MAYSRIVVSALALFVVLLFSPLHVSASSTLGTIDPRNVGNFKALLENSSVSAPPGEINFGKFTTESSKNITVSDTELRGFGWGEGIGWFVVNCADTTSGCSSANSNFKVANDGAGDLSGSAWGEQTGWINFGPFLNPLVSTVKITNGFFGGTLGSAGYAWSQNFGWIKFDCSSPNSCVETDWGVSGGGGSGGGGSGGGGGPSCPTGTVYDPTTGQCITPPICPNTTDYSLVPLLSPGGSVKATIPATSSIGFAIETFDKLDPVHPAGTFATENALNTNSDDQVVVYTPTLDRYILGFEDLINGDYDYNDLAVGVALTCAPAGQEPCPVPNALGDTTVDTVHNAPPDEANLQTIINTLGYSLDVMKDQQQYQRWDVPNNTTMTITATFLARYAGHNDVFGYYTDDSLANFVPLFKTANVGSQSTSTVPSACNQGPCPGGQVRDTSGQCVTLPPDLCPNIGGVQTTMPTGYHYDDQGDCVPDANSDFCPNIVGIQSAIPEGYVLDQVGNCVKTIPSCYDGIQNQNETGVDTGGVCGSSSSDVCSNIPGDQPTVPSGMELRDGQCVPISTQPSCYDGIQNQDETGVDTGGVCGGPNNDLCPNIDGSQSTVPSGMELRDGQCVPISVDTACSTDPNSFECLCIQNPTNPRCLIFPPVKKFPSPGDLLIKTLTALGALLPIASSFVSYALGNPLTWSDLPILLSRGWDSLLVALGLKKRNNPWGVVYDSVTKRPIDPAYVVLTDVFGNEVASAITDIDGRYGFAVDPGTYKLVVKKSNYAFPSTKLAGKTSDRLYDNLYFGEEITITQQGEIITKNIPLDQLAFDWNEYTKTQAGGTYGQKLHFYHTGDVILYRISQIAFWVGFAFAIYAVAVAPSIWNNIVLGLYVVLTVLRATTPLFRKKGAVVLRSGGAPLPFSVVRLMSTTTNTEVAHKVTDRMGTYYGLMHNGTYAVAIDTKIGEESYDRHPVDPIKVTKGYFNKNFKL